MSEEDRRNASTERIDRRIERYADERVVGFTAPIEVTERGRVIAFT
jgi:hypothetical protein